MIGGVNSNSPYTGNTAPARERYDGARAPAARPEVLTEAGQEQAARPSPAGDVEQGAAGASAEDTQGYLRRVQARAAAEDARLQPFRDDDIPLANARALETFASVASQGSGSDGYNDELTGINVRV